jgi:hypothetical protein
MAKQTSAAVRTRRDRWADWAVVGVVVVALLLGWVIKALAEGMTDTYTDTEHSLTLRYPEDWLLQGDDQVAFRAVDPGVADFRTTYEVQVFPVGTQPPTTATLSLALNNVSLARAQETTAFRQFEVVKGRELDGRPTMESTYVFVQKGSDLFFQKMPIVVMGLDIAVAEGDQVYVFSLLARQDLYAAAEKDFRRFVRSAKIW